MTEAHRRKKQPDLVRADLLRSAAEIAAAEGMPAVTLDAVAARAGVTRGGLQHHFRSKQALLEALFCEMRQQFAADIAAEATADPHEHGRMTRAYVRVVTREPATDGEANAMRALLAVLLTEPELRERWSDWWSQTTVAEAAATDTAKLAICRLAADGLWMSTLLDFEAISPALRSEVIQQLESDTHA